MVNGINSLQCGLPRMPWGMQNALSSNDDIFSNMNMNSPFMGGGLSFGGNMFGYGPGSEVYTSNMSQADYLRYQTGLAKLQNKSQTDLMHDVDANKFTLNAADDTITKEIETLKRVIGKNNQDYVQVHYGKLRDLAKAKLAEAGYTNVNETQISAYADKLYADRTHKSILTDLDEHGDGEFVHGFKKGFDPFGMLTNDKSAGENISEITGEEITNADRAWKYTGRVLGTITAIVALPLLAIGLFKGGKAVSALKKAAPAIKP